MRPDITSILLADSDVLAYVAPTSATGELERVFETEAPQDYTESGKLDYIVWTYDGDPENCMRGGVALLSWNITVECYSLNQKRARDMMTAVVAALCNPTVKASMVSWQQPDRNIVTRQWGEFCDFTFIV